MTIRSSPFVNARHSRMAARPLAWRALASLGACGLLTACVHPFRDAAVDPRSPVAAEVAKAVRPGAPYPTFASFPKAPNDVRPRRQYGQAAAKVELDAARLVAATADNTWTIRDTDAFVARVRGDAGPELPPVTPGDTEAFAKDQKARATPPPPVKR
jgi:hypothetical protein